MSTIPITDYAIDVRDRTKLLVWVGMTSGDVGKAVKIGEWPDRSVQIFYTAGSGATILMEGSNDPRANPLHPDTANAVWFTLKDSGENLISTTVNLGVQKLTSTYYVRPKVTGGSTPAVNVALFMTRAF